MPKKASERRKKELEEQNLLLNPMMDMFAVLIPALLMMSVVVEVTVVNVAAPSVSEGDSETHDQVPLNLTVTVTENGYRINGVGLEGADGPQGIVIPALEKPVLCSKYRGTVPPPRSRNKGQPICTRPDERRTFWVYDVSALHQQAITIKNNHPDEHRIIIAADASVDFEPIADVMDATRDARAEGTELRDLFDEVVISPGNQQ